ncbi:MAG: ABC transporter ATP-binding protein [Kiritimatiellia bacterium]
MNQETVISVVGVDKEFRLYKSGIRTLKSAALDMLKRGGSRRFAALKNVDFEVRGGETLGIIGANGAGKSTLLSLVAGTMPVTKGTIQTKGTISSLLELGAGFHPDLTGRENVFLYGAIMGLSKRLMKERYNAILEFAGIGEYIDQPVKHYSSGMYVRLGFAVAVEVNPDLLLVDEVLAVGDESFQRKCMKRMKKFQDEGKTMLIVSHDLPTVMRMSHRILHLDKGTVVGLGEPESVVERYRSTGREKLTGELGREWGTGEVRITNIDFKDGAGRPLTELRSGTTVKARISYEAPGEVRDPVFGFGISDSEGREIYGTNTQLEGVGIPSVHGKGSVEVVAETIPFARGTYLFSFSVHSSDHRTNYHRLDRQYALECRTGKDITGCCYFPSKWNV